MIEIMYLLWSAKSVKWWYCEMLAFAICDVPCITIENLCDIVKSYKSDMILIANVCMFNETQIFHFVVSVNCQSINGWGMHVSIILTITVIALYYWQSE